LKLQPTQTEYPIILEYLNVMLPHNLNILHFYYKSPYFLKVYVKEIEEFQQNVFNDPKNPHIPDICSFLYYPLMPNSLQEDSVKGKRPLSMALKNSSGECFESMIQILMLDPCEVNYMRNIKQYIIKLLSYDSDVIRDFLQTRCHK